MPFLIFEVIGTRRAGRAQPNSEEFRPAERTDPPAWWQAGLVKRRRSAARWFKDGE